MLCKGGGGGGGGGVTGVSVHFFWGGGLNMVTVGVKLFIRAFAGRNDQVMHTVPV